MFCFDDNAIGYMQKNSTSFPSLPYFADGLKKFWLNFFIKATEKEVLVFLYPHFLIEILAKYPSHKLVKLIYGCFTTLILEVFAYIVLNYSSDCCNIIRGTLLLGVARVANLCSLYPALVFTIQW